MTTLTLKVEDSALENVMWFLDHLKDVVKVDKTNLHNDPLAQELKKRIKEIDDGTVELTPHAEVMSKIYAKWEQKCM